MSIAEIVKRSIFTLLMLSSIARADLQIEITRGTDNPTRIAVVPFARPHASRQGQRQAQRYQGSPDFHGGKPSRFEK